MGADGTYLTCPSHKPPSQQEPNIIHVRYQTAPTIFSPIFTGQPIQVPVTHMHLMQIQKQQVNQITTVNPNPYHPQQKTTTFPINIQKT